MYVAPLLSTSTDETHMHYPRNNRFGVIDIVARHFKQEKQQRQKKSNMKIFFFALCFLLFYGQHCLSINSFIIRITTIYSRFLRCTIKQGLCYASAFSCHNTGMIWKFGICIFNITLGTIAFHMLGSNNKIMTFQINHVSRANL